VSIFGHSTLWVGSRLAWEYSTICINLPGRNTPAYSCGVSNTKTNCLWHPYKGGLEQNYWWDRPIPRTIVKVLGLEFNTANPVKSKCNKIFSGIIYSNNYKMLVVILRNLDQTWSKLHVIQIFSFSFWLNWLDVQVPWKDQTHWNIVLPFSLSLRTGGWDQTLDLRILSWSSWRSWVGFNSWS
jgi:hypothetical protein